MDAPPEVIELDAADLHAKLDQIAAVLGVETAQPFRQLLQWYTVLLGLLREKDFSLARLRKMVFGAATERTSQVLPSSAEASEPVGETSDAEPAADPETSGTTEDPGASGSSPSDRRAPRRRRRPGHGRRPASQYTGCATVMVTHATLCPGDDCPDCARGTVYRQSRWAPVVRLTGQVPIVGQVYQKERLRCHTCGKVFTAELPPEAGPDKYDPTVPAVVATLRYGEGFPWNRLERMQRFAGVPLPASVQWEQVSRAAERGPRAVYEHLFWLGAQGDLVHNDDTPMRVLELKEKTKHQQPLREDDPQRRGVFTTSLLSLAEGRPTIALFFTGPRHAGENLRTLLERRATELPLPIQMCDALSRNMPEDLRVLLANCLVHGRRNFVDVVGAFPVEVGYVLHCLKQVYQTEAQAQQQQLSSQERLKLHQAQSEPVMEELQKWLKTQLDDKRVEPNSSLGGAIAYMLRHWKALTLFLRVPGAPLDNNVCERALKMAIRHRKNSLFYKTLRGAAVGDLYMSLIHTCYFAGVSPFDYLTELQRNHERVQAAPADWLPWNYRQQLAAAKSAPTPGPSVPGGGAVSTARSPPSR
jgi:transposase